MSYKTAKFSKTVENGIRLSIKGEMQKKNLRTENINSKSNRSRTSMTSQIIKKSTWCNYLYQS